MKVQVVWADGRIPQTTYDCTKSSVMDGVLILYNRQGYSSITEHVASIPIRNILWWKVSE